MVEVRQTAEFAAWFGGLRDLVARTRITARIDQLAYGLKGDVKAVGEGVRELRIHVGPGYRVYIKEHGGTLTILLCGGDKSSQERDIRRAKEIARRVVKTP
ncbi:type II toxin-antitoxin system RelE/ParE family toxin [Caulobacter sp. NIBR2454]|uniref:type II toxin-antitoxin system RelE/ParE family toxin n=1 Tax=Caulobacter sp. NIBR2454 TaxID=3015996 RepID=UPI0022B71EA8|nr:type II toxin-antitoxin system RelE/ParE family toxin [Caulobacter sp. NIBR2454]